MAGYVFISYSQADRQYAEQLATFLTGQGISVWYDHQLTVGDRFDAEIQVRIDAAAAVILIMTPLSVDSIWVSREIGYADEQRKPIFPLMLRPAKPPIRLTSLHYEDVTGGRMPSASLVSRLQALAGRTANSPSLATDSVAPAAAPGHLLHSSVTAPVAPPSPGAAPWMGYGTVSSQHSVTPRPVARTGAGGGIQIVGGLAAAVGVFLPWMTISMDADDLVPDLHESATGLESSSGLVALIAAVAVVALAHPRVPPSVRFGVAGVLVAIAFYNLLDLYKETGSDVLLGADVRLEPGIWLVAAGALVALVGSIISALTRRKP